MDKITEYKVNYSDAMYAHSWLEAELCELFADLVGCSEDVAARIFFNMDYRRYKVMSELVQKKYPKHLPAWKKIKKWICDDENSINNRRNKLAHWRMILSTDVVTLANPQKGFAELINMALGNSKPEGNLAIEDLEKFTSDTNLLAELINQLYCCMTNPEYEKGFEVFLDISCIRKPSDFENRIERFRQGLEQKST